MFAFQAQSLYRFSTSSQKSAPNSNFSSSHVIVHNLICDLNSSTIALSLPSGMTSGIILILWNRLGFWMLDVVWYHGQWCIMGEVHSWITTKIAFELASSVRFLLLAPLLSTFKGHWSSAFCFGPKIPSKKEVVSKGNSLNALLNEEGAPFKWICVVHVVHLFSYSCICFDLLCFEETEN